MINFITNLFNIDANNIDDFFTVNVNDTIEYHIKLKIKKQFCPYCGAKAVSKGIHKKTITYSRLKDFKGLIVWYSRRYKCKCCNSTFIENNPFAFPGFNISYNTMRSIMVDLKNLNYTYKNIAEKNDISITQVQKYFDSYVNVPRIKLPESIGIDEIHSNIARYGSAYICIMVDNEKRVPFEILPSRSKYTLSNYFSMIDKKERQRVKYITIDMWKPYKEIANTYFKNAIIAVDPFHVIKHLTFGFTKIRINIQNQVNKDSDTYYLLKNWHKLLEYKNIDLYNEPQYNYRFKRKLNKYDIYGMLLEINENYSCAYYLKEEYLRFNKNANPENAKQWLENIIQSFIEADIPEYREFIITVTNWKQENNQFIPTPLSK